MSPLTGSQSLGDMLRWLKEARAGSGQGLKRVHAACRERLLASAAEELPGDPSGVEALVTETLAKLPDLLSNFEGACEQELRDTARVGSGSGGV